MPAARFETVQTLRFGDVDRAGIAFYPSILGYCHVAFEEFFGKALKMPYPRLFEDRHIGFPTVHLQAEFREALHYGDRFRIRVEVLRVGNRSVQWRYSFFRGRSARAAAQVTSVTAVVDTRRFKSVRIPSALRAALTKRSG